MTDQPRGRGPWPWLLAVAAAAVIGYAFGHESAPRPAAPADSAALESSDANAAMASANAASNSAMAAAAASTVATAPPTYLPNPSGGEPAVSPDQGSATSEDTGDGLSNDRHYTNVDGDQVHSPAYSEDGSVPRAASAQCADGTYSFSEHRQGTCSHHGGVATWE